MSRPYRFYDLIQAGFIATLLCSNLIGTAKIVSVAGYSFSAATLFFPLSYLFGDILTEVYGYGRARRAVWLGFAALALSSLVSALVVALPPSREWPNQAALETIFGQAPRIAGASLIAFFCGELVNAYVLAKLKLKTGGKYLWLRTIGSTVIGEAVDSLIFFPLAFYGSFPDDLLIQILWTNYWIKVAWETLATPLTYAVVMSLKRAENEDYFDRYTKFSPFAVSFGRRTTGTR